MNRYLVQKGDEKHYFSSMFKVAWFLGLNSEYIVKKLLKSVGEYKGYTVKEL